MPSGSNTTLEDPEGSKGQFNSAELYSTRTCLRWRRVVLQTGGRSDRRDGSSCSDRVPREYHISSLATDMAAFLRWNMRLRAWLAEEEEEASGNE